MTFDEWWDEFPLVSKRAVYYRKVANEAWQAATLAEREACAKVCEERYAEWDQEAEFSVSTYADGKCAAAEAIAYAIRARGEI